MDAHELPVGQPVLPFAERFRRRLTRKLWRKAQRGAVALRLDGYNVAHPNKDPLLAEAQQQAVLVGDRLARGSRWLRGGEPAYRHSEALGRYGLEQVIEGIHL